MSKINSTKAFVLIGGAQIVNMIISIIRVKAIAVLMGPFGIGILGLFNSIRDSMINIAHLGIPNSGVRTLSQENSGSHRFAELQGTIFTSLFIQGVLALIIILIVDEQISNYIFDNKIERWQLAAIGLSVWLALIGFAILTILQAHRRVLEIAKFSVYGSLIGSSLGLFFIFAYGEKAIALFVLSLAIGQIIAGGFLILKSKDIFIVSFTDFRTMLKHWIEVSRLGFSLMLSGIALPFTMLIMRSYIQKTAGVEAVGQFEAAWVLSITLVALFLNTMAADYFPKLSSIINDNLKVHQIVNNHIKLILVLAGPLLIFFIGFAPWLVSLLYSQEFSDSQVILQWFMIGNFFKLICLSFSYIILAKGYGRLYLLVEIVFSLCFAIVSWLQFNNLSVIATGPAYVAAYIVQICLLYFCILKLVKFKLFSRTSILITYNIAVITFVMLVSNYSQIMGACFALLFLFIGLIAGLKFLIKDLDSNHPLISRLNHLFDKT